MVETKEGSVQVRFEIAGENTTVFVVANAGQTIIKPETLGHDELLKPVVSEEKLGPVVQDLIRTGGEDMDVSGFESRLRAEMVRARRAGRKYPDFLRQLDDHILQVRDKIEGSGLGDLPKVASMIRSRIGEMADDVWTEDSKKTRVKP